VADWRCHRRRSWRGSSGAICPAGPGSIRPFEGIGLIHVNGLRCSGPIVGAALPLMIASVVALAIAPLMRETYPKPRSL
jgi:hypothetical protein